MAKSNSNRLKVFIRERRVSFNLQSMEHKLNLTAENKS